MATRLDIETFDYDDVRLLPEKCIVRSRSEIAVSTKIGPRKFKLPIVPANMSAVIDTKLAKWLAENEYFYIMHRFDIDPVDFTNEMTWAGHYASISLGVQKKDHEDVRRLADLKNGPEYITIDIAHGDADSVMDTVKEIKKYLPGTFVIAGNVATPESVKRLEAAGADGVKVGIGPGCFVPGTLVQTSNGLRKIEDIVEGEYVLTHGAHFQPVTHKFEFGHHKEIITINGIDCTPDHEFYVCDKSSVKNITEENYKDYCYWVKARDLDQTTQKLIEIEL